MLFNYHHQGEEWQSDFSKPISLSLPLSAQGPRAWYVAPPKIQPVMENGFVGSIALGGKVNFFEVHMNPHGHGTHTETLGHIDKDQFPISKWQGPFFTHALLVTVSPMLESNGDAVIYWKDIASLVEKYRPQALIIRTLPNGLSKRHHDYSDTNFPYLESEIGGHLNRLGVVHLLVDLPSVDRESDEGKLQCHHAFWGYPENPRYEATISEMIFVEDKISDGLYCLSLQPPSFEMDAAPSRPIIYPTRPLK